MRLMIPALALLASNLVACMWTSAGGVTDRYLSEEVSIHSAAESWDDRPVRIDNAHGGVELLAVPGARNIVVRANFVAGANSQEDADAAFADLRDNLVIERTEAGWSIRCGTTSKWHGSVDPESTGCRHLRVELPAGTREQPVAITARTEMGGIHARGFTVNALDMQAPFGLVADVTPVEQATIRLWGTDLISGMCNSMLRLPPETSFEVARLNVVHADLGEQNTDSRWKSGVVIDGFSDAPSLEFHTPSYRWQRGSAPFNASTIELRASIGKAWLTTQAVPEYDSFNACEDIDPYRHQQEVELEF